MRVEILKKNLKAKGNVGDVIDIDAAIGNHLSCVGIVRVVQHDPPSGPSCTVKSSSNMEIKQDESDKECDSGNEAEQPDIS